MDFDFDELVKHYHSNIRASAYPRRMAWEFIWGWVQGAKSWRSLAHPRNRKSSSALSSTWGDRVAVGAAFDSDIAPPRSLAIDAVA